MLYEKYISIYVYFLYRVIVDEDIQVKSCHLIEKGYGAKRDIQKERWKMERMKN